MSDTVETLILDLLEWMGPNPRPYAEALEAWRTSCPRLPVWEEATDRGFIARHRAPGARRARLGVRRRGEPSAPAPQPATPLTAKQANALWSEQPGHFEQGVVSGGVGIPVGSAVVDLHLLESPDGALALGHDP